MAAKPIMRCLCITVLFVLLLVSCRSEEAISNASPYTVTGTQTYTGTSLYSTATLMPSTTPSITATSTQMLTPSNVPSGYTLKDWREPAEVITPENMDRVEKIGELEFTGVVWRFSWSPDGSRFGASLLGPLFVLDPFTFTQQWFLGGKFVAFSYDGNLLETGESQYNLTTGEQIGREERIPLELYPNSVLDIEFSPDGKYIAAGGELFAQIYPIKSGIEGGEFGRYAARAIHPSVSPDSKTVAINYVNKAFTELWDPYLRQPIRRLKLKGINGQGKPRFSKDGKSLFFIGNGTWSGQEATFLQEWDYRTGRPLAAQVIPGFSRDTDAPMDISPISNVAALGTVEGKLYLLELRGCRAIQIERSRRTKYGIIDVAFRPDGKLFATVDISDNTIELWGIPDSGASLETASPTDEVAGTPAVCPKEPMVVEQPIPEHDWFGGGRPYKY